LPVLNPLSEKYIKETKVAYRKSMGQYFTPQTVRDHLISHLPDLSSQALILDPACGSGEFLVSAQKKYPNCRLEGWEIDSKLVNIARRMAPTASIEKTDSLLKKTNSMYDLVIGNPPYYEFKPSDGQKEKFKEIISGRINIFSLFIKIGLDRLKPNGYLAYVVPPSMNNGAYFAKLRNYIIAHANIEYLSILSSPMLFDQANQTVMIIILKKSPNKGNYLFKKNGLTIFTSSPEKLKKAFSGKTTLIEQGYNVATGRVVWNQHRDKLSQSSEGAHLLIWSHNITNEGLLLHNRPRPQYIKLPNPDTGPALVVNRITGSNGNIRLKASLIKTDEKFFGENHVNVITPPAGIPRIKQIKQLEKIKKQITSTTTLAAMQLVTGNTQISRTELECLLPLDI